MNRPVSLPMYALYHQENAIILSTLSQLLKEEGLDCHELLHGEPENYLQHWRDPQILLSQTCGYPLCTLLPEVQVVGTFHYLADGCQDYNYCSQLVVRESDAGKTLSDFRYKRVVCNSKDSQSGYHSLRSLIAPLHIGGKYFSKIVLSGSHRQSLEFLQLKMADIAAIDTVTWELTRHYEPSQLTGLISIGTTPPMPGLPLITSSTTTQEELSKLRVALMRLVREAKWQDIREALLIKDFTVTQRDDYYPIADDAKRAKTSGLIAL